MCVTTPPLKLPRLPHNPLLRIFAIRRRPAILFGVLLVVMGSGCSRQIQRSPVDTAESPDAPGVAHDRINPAVARSVLNDAALAGASDPRPTLELALFDLAQGDTIGARGQLQDITKRNPAFARAPYYLGMMALQAGNVAEASTWLSRAANLSPDDAQVQTNASVAVFRVGNLQAAKRYAQQALRIDPRFPDAHLMLGRVNDDERQKQAAIAHLKTYVELAPDPSPGYPPRESINALLTDMSDSMRSLLKMPDIGTADLPISLIKYERRDGSVFNAR